MAPPPVWKSLEDCPGCNDEENRNRQKGDDLNKTVDSKEANGAATIARRRTRRKNPVVRTSSTRKRAATINQIIHD
jgi:hypothetical protein